MIVKRIIKVLSEHPILVTLCILAFLLCSGIAIFLKFFYYNSSPWDPPRLLQYYHRDGWQVYKDPYGYFMIEIPPHWKADVERTTPETEKEKMWNTTFSPSGKMYPNVQVSVDDGYPTPCDFQINTTLAGVPTTFMNAMGWPEWYLDTVHARYLIAYATFAKEGMSQSNSSSDVDLLQANDQLMQTIISSFKPVPAISKCL